LLRVISIDRARPTDRAAIESGALLLRKILDRPPQLG
jgi:hypothetical protein